MIVGTLLSNLQRSITKVGTVGSMVVLAMFLAVTAYADTKLWIEPVYTFATTPEGWVMIFTNDQSFVARMCDAADNKTIIGCARWPDDPEVLPAKQCIVGIYTNSGESQQDIIDHELRHCREGSYHKD